MNRLLRRRAPDWALACALAWVLGGNVISSPARAEILEAIPLHFRSAEELIPILQPLVEVGGVVTGTGDVLLIRTSAANLEQLRAALVTLDHAPQQLLITVGQSAAGSASNADVRGSVDVRIGETSSGESHSGVNGRIVAGDLASRDDLRNVTSVRALEGNEAYVMFGESRPLESTSMVPGRYGPQVVQTTQYRDVGTGFYVIPRVAGDRVTLEISPQQQTMSSDRGGNVVRTQGATTVVSGKLGAWLEIAGVRESAAGSDRGTLIWGTRGESRQYTAWVKVDALP